MPGRRVDVGLRARIQPEIDEQAVEQETRSLKDSLSDISITPDFDFQSMLSTAGTVGSAAVTGHRALNNPGKVAGEMASSASQGLISRAFGGDEEGGDGEVGAGEAAVEGPRDPGTGHSIIDLAEERNDLLEQIIEILEDGGLGDDDSMLRSIGTVGAVGGGILALLGLASGGANLFGGAWEKIKGFPDDVADAFKDVWDDIKDFPDDVADVIEDFPTAEDLVPDDWGIPDGIPVIVPDDLPEDIPVPEPDWLPIAVTTPDWLPVEITEPDWLPIGIPEPDWLPIVVKEPGDTPTDNPPTDPYTDVPGHILTGPGSPDPTNPGIPTANPEEEESGEETGDQLPVPTPEQIISGSAAGVAAAGLFAASQAASAGRAGSSRGGLRHGGRGTDAGRRFSLSVPGGAGSTVFKLTEPQSGALTTTQEEGKTGDTITTQEEGKTGATVSSNRAKDDRDGGGSVNVTVKNTFKLDNAGKDVAREMEKKMDKAKTKAVKEIKRQLNVSKKGDTVSR